MDPENIEVMLSSRFEDFGFGPRRAAFYALLGEGIFNQEGPPWRHSRELLRRQFVRMQYQNLGAFREHVDNMIGVLDKSERRCRSSAYLLPLHSRHYNSPDLWPICAQPS